MVHGSNVFLKKKEALTSKSRAYSWTVPIILVSMQPFFAHNFAFSAHKFAFS